MIYALVILKEFFNSGWLVYHGKIAAKSGGLKY
jgi:hypothetical protein